MNRSQLHINPQIADLCSHPPTHIHGGKVKGGLWSSNWRILQDVKSSSCVITSRAELLLLVILNQQSEALKLGLNTCCSSVTWWGQRQQGSISVGHR